MSHMIAPTSWLFAILEDLRDEAESLAEADRRVGRHGRKKTGQG